MKKGILNTQRDDVFLYSEASEEKFYGVNIKGCKGFIMKPEYYVNKGYTIVYSESEMTKGNGWSHNDSDTLIGIIENSIRNKDEVFEFETAKELFKWLAE